MPTAEEARAELQRRAAVAELARRRAERGGTEGFVGAESGATAPRVGLIEDVARSGVAGLVQGVQGLGSMFTDAQQAGADFAAQNIVRPVVTGAARLSGQSPQRAAETGNLAARGTSAAFTIARRASGPMLRSGPAGRPTTAEALAPTGGAGRMGGAYRPTTSAGGYARAIGQNAVGALIPGGLLTKAAGLVVPAVTGEAAGQAVEAAGGPEWAATGARIGGNIAGGGLIAAAPRAGGLIMRAAGRGVDVPAAVLQAEAALTRAGIAPATLTAPQRTEMIARITRGLDPETVALQIVANDLPTPVPLTRGRASGQAADQAVESAARRGVDGPNAASMVRGAEDDAQTAVRANLSTVADDLAGGAAPAPQAAGAAVSERLTTMADTQRTGVTSAYKAARDVGTGAHLPAAERPTIGAVLRQSVSDYHPENIAPVTRELDMIDGLSTVTARDLFEARRRLTNLRASNERTHGMAAKNAVEALDGYIDDAVARDLFTGDPRAVTAWREAIGRRRAFGRMFEGDDMVERLTEREPRSGALQLSVDPNDAANYILGRAGLGFVGRRNFLRDAGRLRDVLGPDSAEWNGIRSAVFQRFVQAGDGAFDGAERAFSGQRFATEWANANARDPRLMNLMFTADERQTITRLAAIAQRATTTVAGGFNPSNTTTTARVLDNARGLLRRIPALGPLVRAVESGLATRDIRRRVIDAAPARGGPRRPIPRVDPALATPGLIGAGVQAQGLLTAPAQ